MTNNEYIGKTCPFCQAVIKPGTEIVVCDKCNTPHHIECWHENGGCSTYGCEGAPISTEIKREAKDGIPPEFEEEFEELSVVEKIIGVYTSPVRTFRYLALRPDFWSAFIILSLVSIALAMILIPKTLPLTESYMIQEMQAGFEETGMPDSEIAEAISIMKKGMKIGAYVQAFIGTPIGLAISWLLLTVLVFFISLIQGLRADFKRLLGVLPWLTLISIFSQAIVFSTARLETFEDMQNMGSMNPVSLAALIPKGTELVAWQTAILGSIDPFFIWSAVVMVFALEAANQCSRSKAITTTIIAVIISTAFMAIMAQIGSMFSQLG